VTPDWKSIAELIGIAAVVASLIFVGQQLRLEHDIAVAQIYADHDDTQIAWAQLVAENKSAWVKGLKGEQLTDDEAAIFHSLAAAYFHKENDRYRRALLISGIPPVAVTTDFAHVIHSYPGLEAAWQKFGADSDRFYDVSWLSDFNDGVRTTLTDIEAGRVAHVQDVGFAPN